MDIKLCKCNCGQFTKWNLRKKRYNEFLHGHHKGHVGKFKAENLKVKYYGTCFWCKNQKQVKRHVLKGGRKLFCSKICRANYDKSDLNFSKEKIRTTLKKQFIEGQSKLSQLVKKQIEQGRIYRECEECKKSIRTTKTQNAKTCSKICSVKRAIKLGLHKGKNGSMYGKYPKPHTRNIKNCSYNGIVFRSSWEKKFAQKMDELEIKWIYEPKPKFKLKIHSPYGPDFLLTEYNKYIEIKGVWNRNGFPDKERIDEFKELYPNINFEILQSEQLKKLKII